MASVEVLGRSGGPPPYPDITTIPTPPLQQAAVAIIFVFPALSIILFSMRAYIRIAMRQWGWDDFLCGLALLFSLLMTGPLLMFIKLNYFGWRQEDVPEFDPRPGFWWNFLVQMFYNPVLALVKASILFFLLRLGGQKQGVRYAIYALNIFNASHAVAVFFTALFQCIPLAANWDFALKADPDTKCIHNSFHIIASILTIVTDILILALPFWIFLGLKMPRVTKIAVIGVFLMGSVVAIVGIIRVVDIWKLFLTKPDPNADPYHSITLVYSSVEVNLAIMSATIPTLRPLMRQWFPSLFGTSTVKSGANPYYGNSSNSRSRGLQSLQSRDPDTSHGIALKSMGGLGMSRVNHTEITSKSPNSSEEEMIRYHGIMRTTNVNVEYEKDEPRHGF